MLNAIHALMYVKDARAARAFFKDVLGWPHVDAGEGWLIFALPPAEMGVHPIEEPDDNGTCELYLMCDDIEKTVAELRAKGVEFVDGVTDAGYGFVTHFRVPGDFAVQLYQPRHATAIGTVGATSTE